MMRVCALLLGTSRSGLVGLWLLLCVGTAAWAAAPGAPMLVLGTDARAQALWPHLSRFEGNTVPRDWTEARQQRDRFVPVAGRHATLGLQAEPVWLHLDLQVDSAAAGGWVLNGQKTWTTRGAFCTHLFGLFRTDPEAERHKGMSYLLIPLDADGVTVRGFGRLDGDEGFAEVFFDGAFGSSQPPARGWSSIRSLCFPAQTPA